MPNRPQPTMENHRKKAAPAGQAYRFAVIFTAFAVCFAIVWVLIEFRGSLFRSVDPGEESFSETTTKPVPPISVADTSASVDTGRATESLPFDTDPTPIVTDPPVTTEPPVTTNSPATTKPPVSTNPPVTTTPPVTTDLPVMTDPPVMTNPPVTEPPVEPYHTVLVAEAEKVEDSYFTDAAFIGDSRTVGLQLYSGLRSNYYSERGLNVSSVQTKAYISDGDEKRTLKEALTDSGYTKVYISFGINEIGWPTTDSFVLKYTSLVELVRECLPDALIYVQSVLPMSQEAAESDRYSAMGGNEKVAEYNDRLYTLCEEQGLYYVNVSEIFADENGDLAVEDSFDGIHLGVSSSKAWADYLRTHTVP